MDEYVYIKQRKITMDGWAVFFDVDMQILCPNHVVWQAAEAKQKLKNSHNDDEKKEWD